MQDSMWTMPPETIVDPNAKGTPHPDNRDLACPEAFEVYLRQAVENGRVCAAMHFVLSPELKMAP